MKYHIPYFRFAGLGIPLLAACGWCQTSASTSTDFHFVDLDAAPVLQTGATEGSVSFRGFGKRERLNYFGAGLRAGIGSHAEVVLKANFAKQETRPVGGGTLSYGGNDFEAGLRYQPASTPNLSAYAGVSLPNTAAQNRPILTLGAAYSQSVGNNTLFVVNPKAIALRRNTLVGIGFGLNVSSPQGFSGSVEVTPIVAGDNNRDIDTGDRKRSVVYGAALHYTPVGSKMTWSLGYTTATGNTTGASLTPGLDGSGALYLSLTGRF